MLSATVKKLMATSLVVAMFAMYAPLFAAPTSATLTGTVFGENVSTPLAGATVVVTDPNGAKLASQPTSANGAFTVANLAPGSQNLAIETKDGAFAIPTPITLAPGETKGVQLALKAKSDPPKSNKKKGGAYWTPGAKAAMYGVLIGFVAAGAIAVDQAGKEASPYQPPPDKK